MTEGRRARILLVLGIAAVVALPCLPVPEFWITQMNTIGMAALVVLGLVLLTGIVGLTSFGQAAFVGVGAYATAWGCTAAGWSPWLGLAAGLAATLVVALVVGGVTLRLTGHDLPLATLGFGLAAYFLAGNIDALGKFDGLQGLPPVSVAGHAMRSGRAFYALVWMCAGGGALALHHLLDSRAGRALRASRGDPTMAEAMGVPTARYQLLAFVIAALYASLSGWLFAHDQRSVSPSPFGLQAGIEYLFMAVLGGAGFVPGAFVGAAVVVLAQDRLQSVLPTLLGTSGPTELIVFGIVLVALLQVAPDGLWSVVARRVSPRRRHPRADTANVAPLATLAAPLPGECVLRVMGARKTFGGLVAIEDVDFEIGAGEIVGLVGPNGAGKSTLFDLITGVSPLTAGHVEFRGRRIDGLRARAIAAHGMARTFQHVRLIPGSSVLDNVALGAHRRGRAGIVRAILRLDRSEERRLFAEASRQLDRVGLAAFGELPADHLSLGPQRLVEIARAMCAAPALLLLDEPAAGLRLQEKRLLADVLTQLRAQGMSLLLVEHDMDFVMTLADRLVVLESGRKLADGSPAAVRADPAVRAAYLGEVP